MTNDLCIYCSIIVPGDFDILLDDVADVVEWVDFIWVFGDSCVAVSSFGGAVNDRIKQY